MAPKCRCCDVLPAGDRGTIASNGAGARGDIGRSRANRRRAALSHPPLHRGRRHAGNRGWCCSADRAQIGQGSGTSSLRKDHPGSVSPLVAGCLGTALWPPLPRHPDYQFPCSPITSIARTNRSDACRQFVCTARWAAALFPVRIASTMTSCSVPAVGTVSSNSAMYILM